MGWYWFVESFGFVGEREEEEEMMRFQNEWLLYALISLL